jgi:hypothetical protein
MMPRPSFLEWIVAAFPVDVTTKIFSPLSFMSVKSVAEKLFWWESKCSESRRVREQIFSSCGQCDTSTATRSRSSYILQGDKTALQRWNPTVEALKEILKTTGIDLELFKSLNGRIFHNAVLLRRAQSSIFEGRDRRDLVLQRGRHDLPRNEEALR